MSEILSDFYQFHAFCYVCPGRQAQSWSSGRNAGSSSEAGGVILRSGSEAAPSIPPRCEWEGSSPAAVAAVLCIAAGQQVHSDFLLLETKHTRKRIF